MTEKERTSNFAAKNGVDAMTGTVAEAVAECLRLLSLSDQFNESLVAVLEQLGRLLSAQHVYLYQLCGKDWRLWHEWRSEKQVRTDAVAAFDGQSTGWRGNEPFVTGDLTSLRDVCPALYEALDCGERTSAAMLPLESRGTIVGCLGVKDFSPELAGEVGALIKILGCALMTAWSLNRDEEELGHLRCYDSLTGVFHRGMYLQEIQTEHTDQKSLGIIRFQIIDIKRLNECYGYAHGDELLSKCAMRAAELFSRYGNLYRVGCDEFALICMGLDRATFEQIAAQLSPDFESSVHCAVAVGYQWSTRPRMLQRLDLAAEAMMEEDKWRYVRLQALMDRPHVIAEDTYGMLTIDGVTTLLEENRFVIYLQPKLSFQDAALVGAEALVRFLDSAQNIVEPGRFLPDLEAAMLIKYVDQYVFEQVCRLLRSWLDRGMRRNISVSVNFSKMTLEEPNLVPHLLHICRKYGIEPSCLEVEIAGGLDRQHSGNLSKIVDKIRAAGFVISMDDFGIRFANLSLLISLDCDKLKLDKSLVESVTTSPKARSILQALSTLCTATGTKTTVEGIETEEQLAILKSIGFDEMQGYLISQPLTIKEFQRKYLD